MHTVHTAEPPLRDREDLSTKDTMFQPHANTSVYYLTSEIGMTSLQGTNGWPHTVPCSDGSLEG